MKKQDDWKYVGGTGIWTEYKNTKTGESTIKSFGKIKDLVDSIPPECDCYYEIVSPGSVQCQKCGRGKKMVWGPQILRNGKIIRNI